MLLWQFIQLSSVCGMGLLTKSAGQRLLIKQNGHDGILLNGLQWGHSCEAHAGTVGQLAHLLPQTQSCVSNCHRAPACEGP